MKFDYAIGNPPYQDESVGDQKTFAPPVYNKFLDAAYQVADKVMMVHPGRFLFNAGATPKDWNKRMLEDPHLKVVRYEADGSQVFPGTDIKGGVAVTYRDNTKEIGPVGTFVPFDELRNVLGKVMDAGAKFAFEQLVYNRGLYRFSKLMYDEHPDEMTQFTDSRINSPSFERLPDLFFETKPDDGHGYVQIYGLIGNDRVIRWFREDYVDLPDNFDKYKVFIPKANGSGALGEVLSTPVVGQPVVGHTESFMSIGCFDSEAEAEACLKYVKTKFARAMLGILKITQDNPPEKWRYVPLQDFTSASDIDWTKPVAEIDRQLYAKYGLDDVEVAFIESHVKEMG